MSPGTVMGLGTLFALVCTVLSLIFVTPDAKREGLNPFLRFFHDLFNFKWLILEKILKVLYIFTTLFCFGFGIFFLFADAGKFSIKLVTSISIILLGPITLRLLYEILMMSILLLKNTIEINNKMGPSSQKPAPEPQYVFCSTCGARCDASQGVCPYCGTSLY